MTTAQIVTWVALGATWVTMLLHMLIGRLRRQHAYYKGRLDEMVSIRKATSMADYELITRDQIATFLGEKEAQRFDADRATRR